MRSSRQILEQARTIAVVGASTDPAKAAHAIPAILQQRGYRLVPVNPYATEVLGEPTVPTVDDLPEGVDVIEVFRPASEAVAIVEAAARQGIRAVWLQLGIVSPEAKALAESYGIDFVQDQCMGVTANRYDISAPGRGPGE